MALAMHLCPSEVAAYDASLALVDENGTDGMQAEATFVRQQLALHASYVNACDKHRALLGRAAQIGRAPGALRFPIRLTQKTRECVEDGDVPLL